MNMRAKGVFALILLSLSITAWGQIPQLDENDLYYASTTVELLGDPALLSDGYIATQIVIIDSMALAMNVSVRLSREEKTKLLSPYQSNNSNNAISAIGVLLANVKAERIDNSYVIRIEYKHPDPALASLIANLYANEYINYDIRKTVDASMRTVEDLRIRTEQFKNSIIMLGEKCATYQRQIEAQIEKEGEDTDVSSLQANDKKLKLLEEAEKTILLELLLEMEHHKNTIAFVQPTARIIDTAFPPVFPGGN